MPINGGTVKQKKNVHQCSVDIKIMMKAVQDPMVLTARIIARHLFAFSTEAVKRCICQILSSRGATLHLK